MSLFAREGLRLYPLSQHKSLCPFHFQKICELSDGAHPCELHDSQQPSEEWGMARAEEVSETWCTEVLPCQCQPHPPRDRNFAQWIGSPPALAAQNSLSGTKNCLVRFVPRVAVGL